MRHAWRDRLWFSMLFIRTWRRFFAVGRFKRADDTALPF